HMMIAHSLPHPDFGPAQQLHGATYVVDLALRRETLNDAGVVADIGMLSELLATVLSDLNYRNLDDHPDFAGMLTTTEALAQVVADRVAAALPDTGCHELEVTLLEHPGAWASYRRSLR
ncbi:MAG TPA: 6-carboxytetrahydropterin synthase, partial [Actinomycetaceae bacterium]|nr:6-carboxytetrahydropterin synthase [Actinomycetaceae bacterium]